MSLLSVPNVFSAGAVIIASQHNANFSTIYSDYNGNVDNTNIATNAAIAYSKLNLASSILNADVGSGAAIAYSKLNLATSILNADISASAAIVDTKLAQITTASKVSGAAITALASLPSGAGIIPTANLPTLGAMTLISTTTVTATTASASISITSGNTYFVQYDMTFPVADDVSIQFNGDTGSNYKFINYGNTTTGVIANSSAAANQLTLGRVATNSGSINGIFYIKQSTPSSQIYRVFGQNYFDDNTSSGLNAMMQNGGSWSNSATATSFVMKTTNANNMTGTVYLYKLAIV